MLLSNKSVTPFCLFYLPLAVDCGYIATPQNGTKLGEETTYPHSMEFSCDEGFIMLGSSIRNCQANGTWDGQETTCEGNNNLT